MEKHGYNRKREYTKSQIKKAFIHLLEQKNFNAITISDITKVAHINRGTFYLHYTDKYDLMEKCEDEIFQYITEIRNSIDVADLKNFLLSDRPHPFIVKIFTYFQDNASFLKVILGPHGDPSFEGKLRNIFIENIFIKAGSISKGANLAIPLDLLTQFLSSAQIGVVRYWLNSGMKQTPEEMAKMMFQIISKGPLEASGLKKYI